MTFANAARRAGLSVCDKKQAIQGRERQHIKARRPLAIRHSVNVDADLRKQEPNARRWDYGIGISRNGRVGAAWIEAHEASRNREVDNVLNKLAWLKNKLRSPGWSQLRKLTYTPHSDVQKFWWLAPAHGSVRIRPGSRESKKLAQAGIKGPAREIRL